jgi:predicted nucleotidyltransferase
VEKEKLINRKIEENIIKLSEEIFQEAREYEDQRALAFDRIQVLLFMHKVGIRLYGSCANSIAIKNSDIDIAIEEGILTWYPCLATPKAKLIAALQYLSHIFSQLPWIGKCNLI